MKKIALLLIISASVSQAFAQDLNFESLKLNSSPAYVVLGVDPQNIQRPNSPTDFIADAQTALVNGQFQPNFALETTPYYWTHPKSEDDKRISLYQFLGTPNNLLKNIGRTFALSIASSESDTATFGEFSPGTGFGIGAKFVLFDGHLDKTMKDDVLPLIEAKIKTNLYQSIKGQLLVNDTLDIDKWKEEKIKNAPKNSPIYIELLNSVVQTLKAKAAKNTLLGGDQAIINKELADILAIEKSHLAHLNGSAVYPLTREGFMLEFAMGNAAIIQDNEWKNARNAKTAIWITPSYRFNTRKDPTVVDFLDVMAVVRLTWNNNKVDRSNYFDAGGKIQYTHNRFSLSGEYIARMLTVKPDSVASKWTNRLDLSLDYKVNDFITFKTTFGRNFDGNSIHYSDPSKMFAVGGFNFGFSNFFKKTY